MFFSLGQYVKAKGYFGKALVIKIKIGDRAGEASSYDRRAVFSSLDEYHEAIKCHEKAIAITVEIGDRKGEATQYGNLAGIYRSLREYEVAEGYYEKALLISKDTGDSRIEFESLLGYAISKLNQGAFKESVLYLLQCIEKFEFLRNFLGVNDHFKTSFLEEHGVFPYYLLSRMLSFSGRFRDALYVEELGRARGLSELMAGQENNCACLHISYYDKVMCIYGS